MTSAPACFGLAFWILGYYSNSSLEWSVFLWTLVLSLSITKKNFIYVLLFSTGLLVKTHEDRKEVYWNNFLSQQGFAKVYFEWEEDVYPDRDWHQDLRGWARVYPMLENEPIFQWGKRMRVQIKEGTQLPLSSRLKGSSFLSRVALDRNSKSILQFHRHSLTFVESNGRRWRNLLLLRLETNWERVYSEYECGLLRALISGNRRGLTTSDLSHFKRLNLMHVLALSGLHVGLLFGFVYGLLRLLKCPNVLSGVISLGVIWIYGECGAWVPSLLRAVGMCIIWVVSIPLGRKYALSGLNVLAFMALVELNWRPEHLESLSFQLSYLGVLGIFLILPICPSRLFHSLDQKRTLWKRVIFHTLDFWVVSCGAILWTWPVIAFHFKFMPTWAWLLNVPMVLIFPVILATAMFVALLSFCSMAPPQWTLIPIIYYFKSTVWLSLQGAWIAPLGHTYAPWLWGYYGGAGVFLIYLKKLLSLRRR